MTTYPIVRDVLAGTGPDATAIVDRAEAITHASREAAPGDVIVVAGKGHEDYQIVGTEKRDFDDRQRLSHALSTRTPSA